MYTEHFGLESPVGHDGIARDDRMFRGGSQRALLTDIGTALCRGDSVALIYGPAGVGKSTVAAAAFRESATQLTLGCLPDAPQTGHELLEQLLLEFGFTPYKLSRTERLAHWRQHLAEMSATGTRIAILVEDADEWRPTLLAELEKLSSADVRGGSGANLLLTARQPIPGLGTDPTLTALCQRCRCVVEVSPISAQETDQYLAYCVEQAGGEPAVLFEDGAVAAIYHASGGVFRLIDSILETCLARGAREGVDRIGPALVTRVIESLPAWSGQAEAAMTAAPVIAASDSAPTPIATAAGADTVTTTNAPAEPIKGPVPDIADEAGADAADTHSPNLPSGDIPVLEDAVSLLEGETVESAPAVAQEILLEVQLDDRYVESLLTSDDDRDGDMPVATDEMTAAGEADREVPELSDAVDFAEAAHTSDTEDESVTGLSDEDRQQIEMLEAFANAEALEHMSEAMAETIFGDYSFDEIAQSLQIEDEDPETTTTERDAAAS